MGQLLRKTSLKTAIRRLPLLCALACLGSVALSAQTPQSAVSSLRATPQANRIAAHPDLGPRVVLTGHLPRWATPQNQQPMSADLSSPMRLSVVLQRAPQVEAAFEQLTAAQQDPSSPLYHQWLTPQQVGTLYGPTQADVDAVTAWLTSEGLQVESIAPSRMIIEVTGSGAVAASAFRVNFAYFWLGGRQRLSATANPSIPTTLQPVLRAVDGLSDVPLDPAGHGGVGTLPEAKFGTSPQPLYTLSSGSHLITPNDFATIYDIVSIHSAGNTGATIGTKPQHIAVIDRSDVVATDISLWAANVGLAGYNLNTIFAAGVDPGATANGDQLEATGDVNQTLSTANGAITDLVVAANANGGIFTAASYNVNTLVDPVMNISFYGCEANAGASSTAKWDTLFQTGAAEGISTFVCAGDSGAAGCASDFSAPPSTTPVRSVNYICSSSYATCVGGTQFNDTASPSTYWSSTNGTGRESALSYIPEGAWNEAQQGSSYYIQSGGGGVSQFITKPSWQTGPGVPADGYRDQPDVSFTSALHDGYYSCLAYSGGDCSTSHYEYLGGTSFAAPNMAAITALLNTQTGFAHGNLNPLLYTLAASTPSVFHDVTVASSGVTGCSVSTASLCNNSTPSQTALTGGLAGYLVTAGYDQATGLGSLDAAKFLAAAPAATATFTLAPTSTALSFTSGATTGNTNVINLASSQGFAGAVALTCTVSTSAAAFQPACAVSSSSVTLAAGGTGSATVTISSTTAQAVLTPPAMPASRSTTTLAGISLFAVLLGFLVPGRLRRKLSPLALVLTLTLAALTLNGCGGKSSSGSSSPAPVLRSSAGTYTVTLTGSGLQSGTNATSAATTTFTLTIN